MTVLKRAVVAITIVGTMLAGASGAHASVPTPGVELTQTTYSPPGSQCFRIIVGTMRPAFCIPLF